MPTIHELASEMYKAFVSDKRNDDTKFWMLRDGSPEWMRDVCFAAHSNGDMLPDDERYEMVRDVVSALDDLSEDEDPDEARFQLEAPIYTHELTAWLASNVNRQSYCDQAMEERGASFTNTIELLQMGYQAELDEVFGLVLAKLTELSEETTDDDTEGEEV